MSLVVLQQLFAQDVGDLIRYIYERKYKCTLGEVYRTEDQALLYAKEGIGIKDSLHCKRLAIDICLFSPDGKYLDKTESYTEFGLFWESLNPLNRWGGHFKNADGNHFQTSDPR